MTSAALRPAVFLDRDGTINVEMNYLHDPALVQLEQQVGAAIARLNLAGWLVLVVTNQAGIARGYYDVAAMQQVHQRISELLLPWDAHIDGWYWCPHHPEVTGACLCRKPGVALLQQAASEHQIDLAHSWMVGDKLLDVEAGRKAGCRSILVTTGYGAAQRTQVAADVLVVPHLQAAVEHILARSTALYDQALD